MSILESSFYDLTNIEISEDCDHGHCVGVTIDHGEGPAIVWVYVKTEEQAKALHDIFYVAATEVQLIDYV